VKLELILFGHHSIRQDAGEFTKTLSIFGVRSETRQEFRPSHSVTESLDDFRYILFRIATHVVYIGG
jgi:hypothetical protein